MNLTADFFREGCFERERAGSRYGNRNLGARDFLEAKTFRLRIRFASLFSKQLLIKEISLIDPTVIWAQNGDGEWRVPSSPGKSIAGKEQAPEKNIIAPVVPISPAAGSEMSSEESSPPQAEEHEFAKQEEKEKRESES